MATSALRRSLVAALAAIVGATALTSTGPAAANEAPPVLDPVAVGAFCDGGPTTSPFSDVAADDPARIHIVCQAAPEVAIAQGLPDGTYRPRDQITRRQMALFLVRMIDAVEQLQERPVRPLAPHDGTDRFTDTQGERPEVIAAVNRLAAADPPIVAGTTESTFSPGAPVTRRQMALLVVRAVDFLAPEALRDGGSGGFTDTDGESAEARRAIDLTATNGVVGGNPDRAFRPGDTLTRRQMALVMTRTLQRLYQEWFITSPFPADYGTVVIEPFTGGASVGGSRTLAATLTDADGVPVAGVELEIAVHRFLEATQDYADSGDGVIREWRTTDAAGRITFTYTGPGEASADELWVTFSGPTHGPRAPTDFSYWMWTTPAGSGTYEVAAFARDGDVLHAEMVEDGAGEAAYLQRSLELGETDVYQIDGAPVSRADWIAALDAELDDVGAAFLGATYSTTGPSTFDLAG
jgi:hypothetical protein